MPIVSTDNVKRDKDGPEPTVCEDLCMYEGRQRRILCGVRDEFPFERQCREYTSDLTDEWCEPQDSGGDLLPSVKFEKVCKYCERSMSSTCEINMVQDGGVPEESEWTLPAIDVWFWFMVIVYPILNCLAGCFIVKVREGAKYRIGTSYDPGLKFGVLSFCCCAFCMPCGWSTVQYPIYESGAPVRLLHGLVCFSAFGALVGICVSLAVVIPWTDPSIYPDTFWTKEWIVYSAVGAGISGFFTCFTLLMLCSCWLYCVFGCCEADEGLSSEVSGPAGFGRKLTQRMSSRTETGRQRWLRMHFHVLPKFASITHFPSDAVRRITGKAEPADAAHLHDGHTVQEVRDEMEHGTYKSREELESQKPKLHPNPQHPSHAPQKHFAWEDDVHKPIRQINMGTPGQHNMATVAPGQHHAALDQARAMASHEHHMEARIEKRGDWAVHAEHIPKPEAFPAPARPDKGT